MQQVFQKSYFSKTLCVEEVPAPMLPSKGILVQNVASLISPGTERAVVRFAQQGLLDKIRSQPERVKLLLRRMKQHGVWDTLQLAKRKLDAPIPLGYSSAGRILEVSPDLSGFHIGQRVACAGANYANHAEFVAIPKNLFVPLPDTVSFEEGCFVAPGAIALHGVRLAKLGLGEVIVVIGLGLIGQLTLQLAKAQGVKVIAIDLDARRLALAETLGAYATFSRLTEGLEDKVLALSGEKGADAIIITAATASQDPITLAGELARDRGRVVVVGDVGMQVPRSIYYRKELSLIVARSYGPGRYDPDYEEAGQSYPSAYVRWTEQDNMRAFLDLVASGAIQLMPLITHRFSLNTAEAAYELLLNPAPEKPPLGIVIQYPEAIPPLLPPKTTLILSPLPPMTHKIGVGFIGAGQFARSVLLPQLKSQSGIDRVILASNDGLVTKALASEYGFLRCSTDVHAVMTSPDVQWVIIATRHESHAALVCEALAHGKHVFVEKPLATTETELMACIQAMSKFPHQRVMVGFNRRFSPLSTELKKIRELQGPLKGNTSIIYRINAGKIPENSWIHEHGGRIVGEVCHFIDWITWFTDEMPVSIVTKTSGNSVNQDVTILLTLSEGSMATLHYWMRHPTPFGKERIEVYSPELVATIDDFKHLRYASGRRTGKRNLKTPAKGHSEEITAFLQCLKTGTPPPISPLSLVSTTRSTFAILESLKQDTAVHVDVSDLES